jgi:hypothetical protein
VRRRSRFGKAVVSVFPNPGAGEPNHIDNMEGDQGTYFLAFPGASLFQH